MLVNRHSIYRIKLHIRSLEVKVILTIEHVVTAQTYYKDGDYKIVIDQDSIEYLGDNMPAQNQIYEFVSSLVETHKPNLTAISAVEFSI